MIRKTHIISVLFVLATSVFAEDNISNRIDEISVEYSKGWIGKIYSVWLKADGTAIYRGDHEVSRLGTFQASFPKKKFKKLAEYLEEINYDSLDKEQNEHGTDRPCFLIKIKPYHAKPKEIFLHNPEDDTAPPKLWAIKRIIESITVDLPWMEHTYLPEKIKPTSPEQIIIPEFKFPAEPPGRISLQRAAENVWLYSREFDPYHTGINIVLDVSENRRTRETIAIDMKNVSIEQILNYIASIEGLTLIRTGRTFIIRERVISL
ncbi:MAG: DUF6438 domain-containing protein [Kiritimatiellae bacterium]|nr:DUF6438 domain-containing protein [Kiritimatiellia bacterium]MDD5521611.1 DUF6438 domain-containing protein [Kiritimatiellia bacterium]